MHVCSSQVSTFVLSADAVSVTSGFSPCQAHRPTPWTFLVLQLELRREAKSLERKFKERNRQALLNVLSDGTSGSLIFAILLQKTEGRAHLFRTLARLASGLSDTAKAFLIIAGTDILLGYHSEEGWTAALRLLSEHYGMEAEVRSQGRLHGCAEFLAG